MAMVRPTMLTGSTILSVSGKVGTLASSDKATRISRLGASGFYAWGLVRVGSSLCVVSGKCCMIYWGSLHIYRI